MEITSRDIKAAGLAKHVSSRSNYYGRIFADKLNALGESPSADTVDKAIGNNSFTITTCDECGRSGKPVVVLGEGAEYESATAEVCEECVKKALGLFGKSEEV